jgi:hypothetical protein
MASSFCRYTQRYIKPTAAFAAGGLSAVIFTSSSTRNDKIEENSLRGTTAASTAKLNGLNVLRHNSSTGSLFLRPSYSQISLKRNATTFCEASKTAPYKPSDPAEPIADESNTVEKTTKPRWGMRDVEGDGLFHGLFPRRQLWRPHLEYPLWDSNWDGRQPPPIENDDKDEHETLAALRERQIRKNGVTRHLILIRHGQYDETPKVSWQC